MNWNPYSGTYEKMVCRCNDPDNCACTEPYVTPLPLPQPTAAKPATPEKLAVYAQRRAAGLDLNHPADCHDMIDCTMIYTINGRMRFHAQPPPSR